MESDSNSETNHASVSLKANGRNSKEQGTENAAVTEETGEELGEPVIEYETKDEIFDEVPDGGWGWWIVVGSVIMHILMGKSTVIGLFWFFFFICMIWNFAKRSCLFLWGMVQWMGTIYTISSFDRLFLRPFL